MRVFKIVTTSAALVLALLTLAACSFLGAKDSAGPTNSESAAPTSMPTKSSAKPNTSASATPTTPELSASSSQIDCQDGPGFLMWQANRITGNSRLKIADLQCESGGPKFGQVIETFSLENGKWISQGLASGPDLSFRTVGECLDDQVNTIACPAQALSEDGSKLEGNLSIALTDKNATWQFAVKD